MLIDSLNLAAGSTISNAVIESAATLPSSGVTAGTLFFKTGSNSGLYYYNGSSWDLAMTGAGSDTAYVNVAGDSMVGALTLAGAPTQDLHAATKAYVDLALTGAATGLDFKDSVRVATVGNITLSGIQTIDNVNPGIGERILVKDQTNKNENGIYVHSSGSWLRASDFNGNPSNEVTPGAYCYVEQGSVNGGTGWVLVNSGLGTIVVGTTDLTFAKITSSVTPTVPYDVATFCSGKPGASEKVLSLKAVTAFTIPTNFTGSVAIATTAATASTVFSVKKNGTQVTTITFAAAGTTGTIGAVGSATSITVGDVLTIEAPATGDATLADIMFTIKGTVA